MSTQDQSFPNEERLKRQELQMDDDTETTRNDRVTRDVRDEDVIETRGETIEESEKPIITPPLPNADRAERNAGSVARQQSTAPAEGQSVPNAGFGTPDLPGHDSAQAGERWQHIQAEFVDDPRKAVGDAHELVGDLVKQIVDAFTKERDELEQQWSKGDSVSTEDLRVCLQHYRAFFSRLAPSANGVHHS
jgi:hypothetical protein